MSPEWERLANSTKKVWRRHAVLIEERWGDAPTSVWNDPRMKAKVVQWRNSRKATPRTADIGITVLSALLKWALLNGHGIVANAAADIPNLYRGGNRQEIIWLPDDIDRFSEVAARQGKPWITDGLRLAAQDYAATTRRAATSTSSQSCTIGTPTRLEQRRPTAGLRISHTSLTDLRGVSWPALTARQASDFCKQRR